MKKVILSILLVLLMSFGAYAQVYQTDLILTKPDAVWVDSRSYNSLDALLTAIGSDETTIYIAQQEDFTGTIPDNVRLKFLTGGSINATGSVTINAKFIDAPNIRIFYGSGAYDFASGSELKSAWFEDFDEVVSETSDDEVTIIMSQNETATTNASVGDDVVLKWNSPGNELTISSGIVISNVDNIIAGDYQIVSGDGRFDFNDGVVLKSTWFSALNEAGRHIDDTVATLEVRDTESISYDYTFGSNITLHFYENIEVGAGKTITIYSPENVVAQPTQEIFTGSGLISFTNAGTVYPEWWGTDLYTALTSLASSGGRVQLLDNTYEVSPVGDTVWGAIPDDTTIEGIGPQSIVKVADGTGNYEAVFSSLNGLIEATHSNNIIFRNFRIDQNITNNVGTIASINGQRQCAIRILPVTGDNITVENMIFDTACGINTVTLNSEHLSNVKVINNTFDFVMQTPSGYDATALYVNCYKGTVIGNTFKANQSDFTPCALEVHIGPITCTNNIITGFLNGMHGTSESDYNTARRNDLIISNNIIRDCNFGIMLWAYTSRELEGVIVSDNIINIDQVTFDQTATKGIGLYYSAGADVQGDFRDIKIQNNEITFKEESPSGRAGMTAESSCGGLYLRPYGDIYNLTVEGNTVRNSPASGIILGNSSESNSVYETSIKNNLIVNAGNNTDAAVGIYSTFIFVAADQAGQTFRNVEIMNNLLIETNATLRAETSIKAYSGGTLINCLIDDNSIYSVDGTMDMPVSSEFSRVQAEITSPVTITNYDCLRTKTKMISNLDATGTVVYNLPTAKRGMRIGFIRMAPHAMRIDPSGTEVIQDAGAGKYLEFNTGFDSVILECFTTGKWAIVGGYGTYTFEP